MSRRRLPRSHKSVRRIIGIALMATMLLVPLPPAIAQALTHDAAQRSGEIAATARSLVTAWSPNMLRLSLPVLATVFGHHVALAIFDSLRSSQAGAQGGGRMPARPVTGPGVTPKAALPTVELEARVASLRLNPSSRVVLQSRQPMLFSAIPIDSSGTPIHGLSAEWESSDRSVIAIQKSGAAVAHGPGSAILTARAGLALQTMGVTVVAALEEFGGKKKQDSTRVSLQARRNPEPATAPERMIVDKITRRNSRLKRQHGRKLMGVHAGVRNAASTYPSLPLQDPNVDPLPDNETSSLYLASNGVGSPPGKKRPGALSSATATNGTENGNSDFNFALPIVSLPGRGIDVSLALVYNSQVWHKSTDSGGATWMTYDVDSGWPATGFRLGFGQIEDQGSAGFTLTDPDGTRHALVQTSAYNYDTKDGTFIHFYGASGWGTLYYPDGTQLNYGAAGGGYRSYPTLITDCNGNYIQISYVTGVGPKIASIKDTLQRYIYFYYASNGDLVAITAPGLTGSSDLQMMRFYYTDVSISSSGLFGSGIHLPNNTPTSVHTLQYVFLPSSAESSGAHVGYKFEYSSYGMTYRTTQFRGMTASSTSLTSAGSITEGANTIAATTTYDYPMSGASLTDVPKYANRTDDWAGRTTSGSAPSYNFANSTATNEKISTVTTPDGTITETHSNDKPGLWDDGLVIKTKVGYAGPTWLTEAVLDWQQDASSSNPCIYQVRTTNVPTGLTKATVLSYTTYNNVSAVSERAFTTNGSVSSTELRRTETTYETSSNYTNQYLLHLPVTVKVFPGGSSTPVSRVDYVHDNYGTSHADMTARSDIVMHNEAYNPFSLAEGKCEWDCIRWKNDICTQYGWICPYVAATDYRGNVTTVKTYPDVATANPNDPATYIPHSTKYDVAGNVTSANVDCCQNKTISYTDSPNTHTYAYPISVTSGNGIYVTTSATYDFNTGLVATTTDENSQVTTNYFNSDSLRINHINFPNGGQTVFYYGGLEADASGRYHYWNMVSTKFGSGTYDWTDVYRFLDGRGALAQVFYDGTWDGPWTTQITEYDVMGRAYRTTNPFADGGYGGVLTGLWTTNTFDHLGRVSSVTMPSGDDITPTTAAVSISYDGTDTSTNNGIFTTVTDQAQKVRRQKVDALGRVVRLDEPTTSGLGTTNAPNQATTYDYDVVDNLLHLNQGSQDRYFKYDSLSRLTYEKQVEQSAPWTTSDNVLGNNTWSRKLSYNSSGLVTDAYDARQIHTTFSYDGLNRVTQISYSDSTPAAHYYYDGQPLPVGAPSPSPPDSYSRGYSTGRLVAMTYGSTATGDYFGYDNVGQVVQQFQLTGSTPTKYKLSYSYNYAGMLTSETYPPNSTYPSGRVVTYAYKSGQQGPLDQGVGKLSSVSDGATTFANNFIYAPHGGLASETWGNTSVHARSYNHSQQASQVKLTLGTTVLQQYDYDYGTFNTSNGAVDTTKNNGQIGKISGTISGTTQWNQGFSYDELGRLSSIAEHQGSSMSTLTYSQGYTFDRYGNRFQSANATLGLPAVSSSEIVAATNRFITTGSTPTTYDAAGNITNDTKFRGLSYAYDANGRQTSASNGTWTETQTYDCAGQRVQTSVSGTTRTLVYDIFGQDIADYSGSTGGTLERENIYRGGLLATYEASSGAIKYVLQDIHGSTRAIMNNSGGSSSVIARHDYLPFGEEISSGVGLRSTSQGYAASDTNRQKYALLERDATTGLDHTWWRKYESLSGRWTSPDPLGASIANPQSFNHYAYTRNDPVNFVDPSGLVESWNCNLTDQGYVCGVTIYSGWDEIDAFSGGPDGSAPGGFPTFRDPLPFVGGQPQNPGFSPEQIKAAVGACTKALFNVSMVDFQASSRGHNGFFNGRNLNISNPNNQETYIVNEVNAYTANQLARIHERIEGLRPGSVGRLAGLTIDFTTRSGNVTGYSPYRNFTAKDVRSSSSTLADVSAVTDTQIFELGNSLGDITGKAIAGKGNEEGPVFEDCVRKQLQANR